MKPYIAFLIAVALWAIFLAINYFGMPEDFDYRHSETSVTVRALWLFSGLAAVIWTIACILAYAVIIPCYKAVYDNAEEE